MSDDSILRPEPEVDTNPTVLEDDVLEHWKKQVVELVADLARFAEHTHEQPDVFQVECAVAIHMSANDVNFRGSDPAIA